MSQPLPAGEADRLVGEYQSRVRSFFRRRYATPDEVDDLVQETLCAVLTSYGRFMHRSSVSTWVFAICRNTYSNHVYRRKREERTKDALMDCPPEARTEDELGLRIAIDGLPSVQRTLYHLFYVEGCSVRQTALRLGRPEGTVKYLLHELRRHLRAMLL